MSNDTTSSLINSLNISFTIIFIVALLSNLIVTISGFWLRTKATVNLKLCISLAAADCWFAVSALIDLHLPSINTEHPAPWLCWIKAIMDRLRYGAMLGSMLHLLTIALNHYVRWPLRYKVWVTTKRIRLIITTIWLTPPSMYVIFGFAISWNDLLPPCDNTLKNVHPGFRLPTVIFVWLITGFVCVIYLCILIYVHQQRIAREKMRSADGSSTMANRNYKFQKAQRRNEGKSSLISTAEARGPHRQHYQAIVTALCITLSVLICWIPNTFAFFLLGGRYYRGLPTPFIITIIAGCSTYILLSLKMFLNALIYPLRYKELRLAITDMVITMRRVACSRCFPSLKRNSSLQFTCVANTVPSIKMSRSNGTPTPRQSSYDVSNKACRTPLKQHVMRMNSKGITTDTGCKLLATLKYDTESLV